MWATELDASRAPPARERIITAALALLSTRAADAVSNRDIARRAGANRQLIR